MAQPVVAWAFSDGKAGHENQTRGLVQALTDRIPLRCHWIRAPRAARLIADFLCARFAPGRDLPDPDLLIGAGHGTHPALLAARRARGGRAVVLMKPSLPRSWFDLCVIPEPDGVRGPNVLVTRGALNALRPATRSEADSGLILIGGPSSHYRWLDDDLMRQVEAVVARAPAMRWTLTTSRRTPPSTLARLRAIRAANLTLVPFEQTDAAWLPGRLLRAACAWVSEDSVSMVYEALTAGAATGLLQVPRRGASRVARGVDRIIGDGLALSFARWQAGAALAPPAQPFNEAARIAAWIKTQWLSGD